MSIQMQLWSIEGDRPVLLPSAKLNLEARLEQWICQDLRLVGEDLLLLGKQVETAYGHAIDVLALDREGNLVILELKRGRTPRDVVAQVLDYASWAHDLSAQEIERLAETYRKRPLEEIFREQFHTDLPESLNEEQRLVIVATQLDPQSERIVQFLSSQYGVNLNVVFFDYYRQGDREFVARSWLIAPEEVERKATTVGPSKKRALLSLDDLAGLAAERGVGDLFRTMHEGLSQICDQVGTTQSNVTYRWRTPEGGRSALVSIHPKVSSPDSGLVVDVRVDELARHLGLDIADLRSALPDQPLRRGGVRDLYLYGEGYLFRTEDEIDRFLHKLAGRERQDAEPYTLFDTYVVIDWSSNNGPKSGEDSIWIGWTRRIDGSEGAFNVRTRGKAYRDLLDRLQQWTDAGDRVLVGFDFAYSYPAGLAEALGLVGPEPPWKRIWSTLAERITDDEKNRNNRFKVAADLNRALGRNVFWGCPATESGESLPTTSPSFPVEVRPGFSLEQYRLTDRVLRSRRKSIQEVWKLFYQASVGGQTLTGIPVLNSLRFSSGLESISRVWPFETGFTPEPVPATGPFILHAEVWPGILDNLDVGLRDQVQVRELARQLRRWDESGQLGGYLDRPKEMVSDEQAKACVEEEGWILGSNLPMPR